MSDSDIVHKHHDLLFGVRRSIRYHYRRVAFFDRVSKSADAFTAITGSATIASALSSLGPSWTVAFASAAAVLSAINVVFTPSQAARQHNDLVKDFIGLEKDILSMPQDTITEERLNVLYAKRLDIESKEPPPLKVLDCICHNELLRSLGYDKSHEVDIKWYQRLASPIMDICDHNIGPKAN